MSVAPAKVVIFQCMTTLAIAFWEVQIGLKYKKNKIQNWIGVEKLRNPGRVMRVNLIRAYCINPEVNKTKVKIKTFPDRIKFISF